MLQGWGPPWVPTVGVWQLVVWQLEDSGVNAVVAADIQGVRVGPWQQGQPPKPLPPPQQQIGCLCGLQVFLWVWLSGGNGGERA